jgi:hypothetical protein
MSSQALSANGILNWETPSNPVTLHHHILLQTPQLFLLFQNLCLFLMAATLCNQISSCNSTTWISFNCTHNLIFYKLSNLPSTYFQISKTKSFYDAAICTTTLFQTCSNLPFNSEQENLQVALQTVVHHFLWTCTNNCNSLKKTVTKV